MRRDAPAKALQNSRWIEINWTFRNKKYKINGSQSGAGPTRTTRPSPCPRLSRRSTVRCGIWRFRASRAMDRVHARCSPCGAGGTWNMPVWTVEEGTSLPRWRLLPPSAPSRPPGLASSKWAHCFYPFFLADSTWKHCDYSTKYTMLLQIKYVRCVAVMLMQSMYL